MGDREDLPSFGRYQVLNLLGKGGTARVYRAMRPGPMGFGKEVAIKVIDAEAIADEEARDSLVNEARLGGVLRHRNIVAIDEFDQVGQTLYIAMEYVDGWSLERILDSLNEKGGQLSSRVICDILIEVCAGLQYAHDLQDRDGSPMNIIHRDLKPGNVMLSRAGEVKLADFGTAKASTNVKKTQVGFTRGTPAYMSPEQVTGKVLDRRSDIFTMGSILFEMVTFAMVFGDDDLIASMRKVLDVTVAAERSRLEAQRPEFLPIFDRCLAKEPADRFQTADEMAAALAEIRDGLPPGPSVQEWLKRLVVELPVIKTGTFGTDIVRTLNAAAEARRRAQELDAGDFEDLSGENLAPLSTGENLMPDGSMDSFFPPEEPDHPTTVARTLGESSGPFDLGGTADPFSLSGAGSLGGTEPSRAPVPNPDDSLDPSGLWHLDDQPQEQLDPYAPLPGERPGAPTPSRRPFSRSTPGPVAPPSMRRSGSVPGAPTPSRARGSVPGAVAPPSTRRSGSVPGAPTPSRSRGSVPGAASPSLLRSGSVPGAPTPSAHGASLSGAPAPTAPTPPTAPAFDAPPSASPFDAPPSTPPFDASPSTPPPFEASPSTPPSSMPAPSTPPSVPPPSFDAPRSSPPTSGPPAEPVPHAAPEPPAEPPAERRSRAPLVMVAVAALAGVAVLALVATRGGSGGAAGGASVPPPPMADVAAASIVLGSNQDRDARPSRAAVAVPGFSMMTREVTVAEFQAGCAKGVFGGCIGWTGPMEGQALDHPVVGVTFGQAEAWCESQGMRLPTESEWELAARGSAGRSYPWGDEWKAGAANYCDVGCAADARVVHNEDDGFPKTAPAGQFTAGATPEGIADLVGNAAEWTLDCWTSDHRARTDWKPSSEACGKRVVRGGDWTGWAHHQTGWRRFAWGNEQRSERIGFRCVRGEPVGG